MNIRNGGIKRVSVPRTFTTISRAFGTFTREKLRLSAVSLHWKRFQRSNFLFSLLWFALAIGAVLCIGFYLSGVTDGISDVLRNPEATIADINVDDGLQLTEALKLFNIERTVRWILKVTIIVSASVYLLRQFVKLGMSSMHLSRDAAERRELSHQYLALIRNTESVSTEERLVILQALFSRSETGLLKHDAGPTLPGLGVLDRFVGSDSDKG